MRLPCQGGDGCAERASRGLYTPRCAAGAPGSTTQTDILYIAAMLGPDTPVGVPNEQGPASWRDSGGRRDRKGDDAWRGGPSAPRSKSQDVGAESGNGGGLSNTSTVGDNRYVAALAGSSRVLAGADGAVATTAEPPASTADEVVRLKMTLKVDGGGHCGAPTEGERTPASRAGDTLVARSAVDGPTEVAFLRRADAHGPMTEGEAVHPTSVGRGSRGRGCGAEASPPLGPAEDQPLPALAPLGDRVLGVMMDAKDRFFNRGDDAVDDRQSQDLAGALADGAGVRVNLRGKLSSRVVDCAVASPIGGIMATRHGFINREVRGNPLNNQVGALHETPEVPIDAFSPVGRHRAMAELLEPKLQVETVGDNPKIPRTVGEPH